MATFEKKIPDSVENFKSYVLEHCKPTIGFGSSFEQYYLLNRRALRKEIESLPFWKEFLQGLAEINAKYRKDNDGLELLLAKPENIAIDEKNVDSAVQKAFRISIFDNKFQMDSDEYTRHFVLPENIFQYKNRDSDYFFEIFTGGGPRQPACRQAGTRKNLRSETWIR